MKTKITLSLIVLGSVLLGVWSFFYFFRNKQKITYENRVGDEYFQEEKFLEEKEEASNPDVDNNPREVNENKTSSDIKIQENKNSAEIRNNLTISDRFVFWGYEKSANRDIDTIILHSSYNILGGDRYDLDKIILEYQEYGVSPHYVIDRKGKIFKLVDEKNIAYHAGESQTPDGRRGVNRFSLGIEIINAENDEFTSAQYDATNALINSIKEKYKIKYILGHNQIAPERKTDPWNINWSKIIK